MNRERALIVGVLGLLGCVAGVLVAPRDALLVWLVAWLAWGSVPIGSLAVLMLLALIPGSWRALYGRPLVIGTTLMPLVALAMIPLLVGVQLIYPWTDTSVTADYAAFKGAWLSTSFFVVRTIVYMAVLAGLVDDRPHHEEARREPCALERCIIGRHRRIGPRIDDLDADQQRDHRERN